MNSNYRSLLIWGVIALILIVSFSLFNGDSQRSGGGEVSYSEFLQKVENNELKSVTIQGQKLTGKTVEHRVISTYAPRDPSLIQKLESRNVNVKAIPESSGNSIFLNLLFSLLPVIIIVGAWVFFMRQMQSGSRGAMGFGKSKAKLLNEAQGRVTFQDVAGVEEAKQDLQEIVEFLREPQKFQRLGGRIPRGVLLVGPPGTGKTLLARSVAGEANVPFFTISGSDFVEMFVGVGASRVRDMFEQAKKNAPCIIFIDEIDAVGRHRGAGLGGGNDEREQTLNQLLVEMDGFEPNESIILIAATNRPDVLDPALLRPGRFDRQVVVPNPDIAGREQILKVHVRNVPLAPNVDLKVLARGTPGFSGADLMNLVNEAALMAASRNKRVVTMQEFEDAKDKVMMGAERRSSAMTQEEKELTAYHEAGHAIVALNVPVADPVHKATIVPRGRALGMVMQLPEGDRYSMSYRWMISRLAIMMGGRVAEELKFGKENITSGASSDIEQATKLARAMITRWGFSDLLGNVAYGDNQDEVFLGHSVARTQNVSEETARMIDMEVRKLIDDAYKHATKILKTKKQEWFALAQGLLEYETLTGAEINEVIAGKPPSRTQKDENASVRTSSVPKTNAGKAESDKKNGEAKNALKGEAGKEGLKAGKGKTKSSDAKSSDAAFKEVKSRGAEKKTQSTKKIAGAENLSESKANAEKELNAEGLKAKQEPSSDV
ncbi:ATP-dependent zinc metalloprotease FtsH [Candidatus Bartonella washoeensis]|uniref:ATP-dependent zinc metalloprotease FtsH n=1 Tax=Candidatus Bartonella washoeensis Sb944nv TaxID=1094563 RepID=J1J822_9HYPH|nr:ATP-dependent zinc metalloprotease FtsH [Bartonella washoeensis]EJF79965.1 ATP-dependent zinc metalloprotease FtsH [Bartonella washoeensis Sb944nv]SPU26079.1 ATP-dependent zinc metalloprotease FtsH [Bartonella washoeensis]